MKEERFTFKGPIRDHDNRPVHTLHLPTEGQEFIVLHLLEEKPASERDQQEHIEPLSEVLVQKITSALGFNRTEFRIADEVTYAYFSSDVLGDNVNVIIIQEKDGDTLIYADSKSIGYNVAWHLRNPTRTTA